MADPLVDLEIRSIRLLTPTVKEFVLRRVDGQPYPFTSGQHVMVHYEGLYREFSIASPARRPETIRLAVRAVGKVSQWLHERQAGDVIQATEANGLEFHPKYLAGRDLWLIAGGIGLTGLVSTIYELEHNPRHFGSNHRLFYGLPNRSELLWPEELERWRSFIEIDITGDGRHLIGDLLHERLEVPNTVTALVCGSQQFSDAVFQVLTKLGIQRTRILTNIWE
ncbi:hypothetical protein HY374_01270 [Candidatus Berkelbacteria bacterium]|nr:hypothetical protein [Candidatus Berkelbacteria bacterium]